MIGVKTLMNRGEEITRGSREGFDRANIMTCVFTAYYIHKLTIHSWSSYKNTIYHITFDGVLSICILSTIENISFSH